MENQGPLILDISSDDEAGFADIRKGGGCEFGDREDVDWLSNIWFELGGNMDDDSDDVVILSEEFAKSPQKSRSESLKPLTKLVDDDDDDDDCIVLDGDPDKSIVVVNNKVDGDDDSDDLEIVGEKGEVACRDFPHPRHHCAKHPFASTPHVDFCSQCHCYVCDSIAPCSKWGTGVRSIDHCHASDKEEYWKTERKNVKKVVIRKSNIRSTGGACLESFFQPIQVPGHVPALANSLPQNLALNSPIIRPCTVSPDVSLQNSINSIRCPPPPPGNVAPIYNPRSQLVSVRSHPRSTNIVAPKVAFRNKSYHTGSQNHPSFPPHAIFKRSGLIGDSTNNRHANQFQLPQNRHPRASLVPVTNGSQAAVSGIPLPPLSSPRNMDAGHANYLPPVPQINSQRFSSYRNRGLILQQSQMSSQSFANGNSSPTLQSYVHSQPTVGIINNSAAPEPYSAYVHSNPLPSQNATSHQSDAGITLSNQLHSGSTISSHSSLGCEFDSGSSQLQERSCPDSSLTSGQNDAQQQHHTQSGMDGTTIDFNFYCDSSDNHNKMNICAEQLQYPSNTAAGTSQVQDTVDIPHQKSVQSGDHGSLDFFGSWSFENQSFSEALEDSLSPNWNIYSPEPAFTDSGTLFDI